MLFPDLDPRLAKWPFMESGTSTVLIVLLYLLFIKVLGPAHMKAKKPYDLRILMIFYNLALVVYCAWMFYKFGVHGWFGKYSYLCEPMNYSEDDDAMGMVEVCWHFSVSKIVELLDTIFFVLRKKDANVTHLHVLHHASTALVARYAVSHGAAGYNTLFGFVNTFVHTWMYLYYGLAAVGPSVQKYLWWKKYLTTLQMIQFVFMLAALLNQAFNPVCETNWTLISASLCPALLFLVLFLNFYRNSYGNRQRRRSAPHVTPDRRASDADAAQGKDGATEPTKRILRHTTEPTNGTRNSIESHRRPSNLIVENN